MLKKYVGIDIGSDSIKLFFNNKTYDIKTPDNSIKNGVFKDITKLSESIKELVTKYKLKGKETIVSYNGPSIYSKIIKIPRMKHKEIKNYLKLERENIVPFTTDDSVFDYIVLEDNNNFMKILVVAIKDEMITPIIKAIKLGGLEPITVTIPGLALSKIIFNNKNKDNNALQLVIDVGKTKTDIHIYVKETFRFSRSINIGGDDFDDLIAKTTEVSKEEALNNRISNKYDPIVFKDILSDFKRELVRSIDYFKHRFDNQENKVFDKVFIVGGNSNIKEIKNIIEEVTEKKCINQNDPRYVLVKGLSIWEKSSDINLLPVEYRLENIQKINKLVLNSILFVIAISVVVWFLTILLNINETNKKIKDAKNDINKLESSMKVNREDFKKLKSIEDIVITVDSIKSSSISHTNILNDLSKYTPEKIKFKTLSITLEKLDISGESPDLKTISLFLDSLNGWNNYEKFFVSQINFRDNEYAFSIQGLRKGIKND